MDTGNHEVNVDDAVLSGKVVFQAKDYVLLLMPGMLVCREFATDTKGKFINLFCFFLLCYCILLFYGSFLFVYFAWECSKNKSQKMID